MPLLVPGRQAVWCASNASWLPTLASRFATSSLGNTEGIRLGDVKAAPTRSGARPTKRIYKLMDRLSRCIYSLNVIMWDEPKRWENIRKHKIDLVELDPAR